MPDVYIDGNGEITYISNEEDQQKAWRRKMDNSFGTTKKFTAADAASLADTANAPNMHRIYEIIRNEAAKGKYTAYFVDNMTGGRPQMRQKIVTELQAAGFEVKYHSATGAVQRDENSFTINWG